MRVEVAQHALDRVPLSLIIDDATLLVNLNYFFMRDRNLVDGQNRRWEDVPVVHPESFTREFAQWCLEQGREGQVQRGALPGGPGPDRPGPAPVQRGAAGELAAYVPRVPVPRVRHYPGDDHPYGRRGSRNLPAAWSPEIWEQYEWETLPPDREELIFDYHRHGLSHPG